MPSGVKISAVAVNCHCNTNTKFNTNKSKEEEEKKYFENFNSLIITGPSKNQWHGSDSPQWVHQKNPDQCVRAGIKCKNQIAALACTAQINAKLRCTLCTVQCSVLEKNQMQKINWYILHYNALQHRFVICTIGLRNGAIGFLYFLCIASKENN